MDSVYPNIKIYRIILIFAIITLSLLFLVSLKPVFASAPIAEDDAYATLEDVDLSLGAPGVAANDSYDGSLTVFKDSDPLIGSLTLDATGAFTYSPPSDYNGFVTFTYHITNESGISSPATVTITVTAVNDPPIAVDDDNETFEDTAVTTDVLLNDSDPDGSLDVTSVTVITAPQNGETEVNLTNGFITYTPTLNFNGHDNFVYQVFDDGIPTPAQSVTATVYLTVTAVNDPPVAVDDKGGSTPEDTTLNVAAPGVLVNDSDPEDLDPSIDQYDSFSAQGATVTLNADGSYDYDPSLSASLNALAVGESITDTFNYTISDSAGLTATAVVSITVNGVNDDPIAADDDTGATTDEDSPLNVSAPGVRLGDTDPDTSDILDASGMVSSTNGASVSINSDGSYTFDPTGAQPLQSLTASGSILDTFTYTVTDGNGGFDTAVVTVTVTGVNDAPEIDNTGDMTLTNIDEDDTDPLGDTVNAIVLSAGGDRITDVDDLREGIAVIGVDNSNGTWQYSIDDGSSWLPFNSVSNFNAVLLDASGTDATRIRFVPDAEYNGSAGNITFHAWDQTDGYSSGQTGINVNNNGNATPYSSATEQATLTVNSINDAPVLDNNGTMVLDDIPEDPISNLGDTVAAILSSAGGDRITDVDAGALEGIAVIGVTNANGTWQYSLDGSNWNNFGSVSDSDAVLLDTTERIRFVPDPDYNGPAGTISFRAWDQTTGGSGDAGVDVSTNGGTTAFSTDVETATLTVIPMNDRPVLDLNGDGGGIDFSVTFYEGSGPVDIVDTDLTITDVDDSSLTSATATLTNFPDGAAETLTVNTGSTGIAANYNDTTGVLSLSGTNSLANYVSVLQTLAYNNSSQNPNTVSRIVEVVVNDGSDTSDPAAESTITIDAQNDPPILDTNDTLPVNEGDSNTISVGRLLVTDMDNSDTEIVYTLSSIPAHGQLFRGAIALNVYDTFTQADINSNSLTYVHDGSETTSDSFIFTVSDSAGGSISATTFTISISGDNDSPILVTNVEMPVNEGAVKTITNAYLKVTDAESANSGITYSITTLPVNGTIKVGGSPVGLNGAFTQADINNNLVTYTHDGSETTDDSFIFRVEDGMGGNISNTSFNIAVNPVNDAPLVDLNGSAAGQEYSETFVEDGGAVIIVATDLSVSDADDTNLISARATLTNHPNGAAESLSASTSGTNITANYNAATGVLALSGTDTVDNYQTVLRSLQYNNTSQDPNTADRVVTIVVDDGTTESNVATSIIDITALNDQPTLIRNVGFTIAYAQSRVITDSELKTTDVDNSAVELIYTLQSAPANGLLKLNGNAMVDNDTFTQDDIDNGRLAYEHDKSNTESDSFTFTISDGDGGTISSNTFNIVIGPQPIVYLPAMLNNYVYGEPNDTACDAFEIDVNRSYEFLPDDVNDFYKFTINSAGPISVKVSNYSPPDGQLLVYFHNSCSITNDHIIGHVPTITPSGSISFASLVPGTYYVRVYTAVIPSNPPNYTLTVSRP